MEKKAENVKQGSSDEIVTYIDTDHWEGDIDKAYVALMSECIFFYNTLIESGVCPEQARMALPQSVMTEWIWSGSLAAFARVCRLRLDSHTQKETREIADLINLAMSTRFPV